MSHWSHKGSNDQCAERLTDCHVTHSSAIIEVSTLSLEILVGGEHSEPSLFIIYSDIRDRQLSAHSHPSVRQYLPNYLLTYLHTIFT